MNKKYYEEIEGERDALLILSKELTKNVEEKQMILSILVSLKITTEEQLKDIQEFIKLNNKK